MIFSIIANARRALDFEDHEPRVLVLLLPALRGM